jgi:hypothetical protein
MGPFHRFAPAIALFYAALAGIPATFGAVVLSGGSPVTPELYGPLVYAIPAKVWISAQLAFASVAVWGAAREKPVTAAIGAHGVSAVLGLLAVLAVTAGATGTIVVAGSIFLAALSTVAAQICWRGRHDGRRTHPGA